MPKPTAMSGSLPENERQSAELAAMSRMLTISSGTSSFSIAICNSPSLGNYLIGKLKEQFDSIEVVQVTKDTTDIYDFVNKKVSIDQPDAIFITGMEPLLPSDEKEHHLLKALNATRELWKDTYSCPVVFWMAEYAATLFSVQARDMWSWLSHQFEFFSESGHIATGMSDVFAGNFISAGNLDADQKRFRIAELEQRIQEAEEIQKSELTQHILLWLNELGFLYKQLGNFSMAESSIKKSLEINEKLGRLEGMVTDFGNLGLIYQTQGKLDKAEDLLKKSLEINEKLGRLEEMASLHNNLGLIYRMRGSLDEAEAMHKKSLEVNEKLMRLDMMASDYSNLGVVYQSRDEADKAEIMHNKSLKINEKLGLLEGMAQDYGNLGVVYGMRGELDKAEIMLKKSLEIDEKLGRFEGMSNQYGNLGVVYQSRDDLAMAKEMYLKSLEIGERLGLLDGMARQCENLGGIYLELGELDKVREYWEKSRDIYAKMGLDDMAAKIQKSIDEL